MWKVGQNSPFFQISAILKFYFQKRKHLRFSEINYLNYTIRPNFACDNYIFPKRRGNNNKQWTHSTPVQLSRAIRIIDLPEDDLISHQIQPLGTRREVGALTLFHRMYYGEAPELLCQLLPEHLQLDPRLRRSVRSHDLAVQIPRSNLVSHKRSFVPSAARIWNSLPEYIPSLEKRACFKKEVNRYLGDN